MRSRKRSRLQHCLLTCATLIFVARAPLCFVVCAPYNFTQLRVHCPLGILSCKIIVIGLYVLNLASSFSKYLLGSKHFQTHYLKCIDTTGPSGLNKQFATANSLFILYKLQHIALIRTWTWLQTKQLFQNLIQCWCESGESNPIILSWNYFVLFYLTSDMQASGVI